LRPVRREDQGSLEAGKLADLVVLSPDIFNIDPVEIENTRVDLTIFDGRVTYDASTPATLRTASMTAR
jgi:predicted amidohydrolase YtcJ